MKYLASIVFVLFSFILQAGGLPLTIKISSETAMEGDTIWMELPNHGTITNASELIWYSSIDGKIAKGNKISISTLSKGKHEITVQTNNAEPLLVAKNEIRIEAYIPSAKMAKLINWMTGYFSSKNQADTSSDKYHVDVRLRMCRIWENRSDGFWIYVEQAYVADTASPYRQRLYHMIEANGQIRDEIYSIHNDSLYLYGWQNPQIFEVLTDENIILKSDCGLVFTYQESNNLFEAKTKGCNCKASIPGISYITSVSKIHSDHLTSWDLGFNDKGDILMGPDSPYFFEKISNFDCKINN